MKACHNQIQGGSIVHKLNLITCKLNLLLTILIFLHLQAMHGWRNGIVVEHLLGFIDELEHLKLH